LWSLIRHEDLVGNELQKRTMTRVFQTNCLDHRKVFKPTTKLISYKEYYNDATNKHQKPQSYNADAASNLHHVLTKFTLQELQFVLDQLDLDFEERVLGYSYDYVREHIRHRSSNNENNNTTTMQQQKQYAYTGPPKLSNVLRERRIDLIRANLQGQLVGRDKRIDVDNNHRPHNKVTAAVNLRKGGRRHLIQPGKPHQN